MIFGFGTRRLGSLGYGGAVLLAVVAQVARIPLNPPTLMPFITYVPFLMLSARYCGFGPGLVTTVLCALDSLYFTIEPTGSFAARDPRHWLGVGTLLFTGVFSSVLFERLRQTERAGEQLVGQLEARRRMLESIIRHSPVAMALLRGPDFAFEMVNPAYEALAPGEPMAGRTVTEVWPEAAPLVTPLLRTVRASHTVYRATGFAVPLHYGPGSTVEERFFDFSYVPLNGPAEHASRDSEGQVLVVAIEVTEHKRAEESLRAAHQELSAIHANAPVALLLVDEQLRVHKVNELAAQFAERTSREIESHSPGGAIGCLNALADVRGCGHGPSCAECPIRTAVLDSVRNGTRHQGVEGWLPFAVDGVPQRRCLLISTAPMQFDGTRKVLVCAQDVTVVKRAEESLHETVRQLKSALAEKTVLLQEVHHRVKNNLAVISSLLSMKAETTGSPNARLALAESQQRVHSIALIHEHLYASEHLDRINFPEYAQRLVQGLYAAFVGAPDRIAVETTLDPIELGIERAVPCALILNELLSNAFKYAFPNGENGRIVVSFRESGPGALELAIEDNGVGLPAGWLDAGPTESLGLRIINILAQQLDGSLTQEPGPGTRIVLRFPAG